MINNKKAAMFGLDARVALAIFGALSVITGVALYSAIQNAKVTAMIAQMQELAKAYEQFYIDAGGHASSVNGSTLKAPDLVVKPASVNGWNGPYIPATAEVNYIHSIYSMFINVYLKLGSIDVAWTDSGLEVPSICSSKCYVWAELTGIMDESIVKGVDKHFDGVIDGEKGKVRFRHPADPGSHVYFAIMPYTN